MVTAVCTTLGVQYFEHHMLQGHQCLLQSYRRSYGSVHKVTQSHVGYPGSTLTETYYWQGQLAMSVQIIYNF